MEPLDRWVLEYCIGIYNSRNLMEPLDNGASIEPPASTIVEI